MNKTCVGPQCSRPIESKGLCKAHAAQMRRNGEVKPLRVPRKGCDHEGCNRAHHAGGYCGSHYRQFKRYGKTFDIGVLYHQAKGGHETLEQFFWARVEKTDSCWMWTGTIHRGRSNYGWVTREGHQQLAHRLSYKLHYGDIPDGMFVDHICHNKPCVRPDHLRLATPSENAQNRRGARSDSTTGIRGVSPNGKRFEARISVDGKRISVGTFDTPEEAGEAARLARLEHYTHSHLDQIA